MTSPMVTRDIPVTADNLPDQTEESHDWFFTFGDSARMHLVDSGRPDQTVIGNGIYMGDKCVKIYGTYDSARQRMISIFGDRWAFQYPSAADAGTDQYHLRELVI